MTAVNGDVRAERAQNSLIIPSMQFRHERPPRRTALSTSKQRPRVRIKKARRYRLSDKTIEIFEQPFLNTCKEACCHI